MSEVEKEVIKVVASHLGVEEGKVSLDSSFVDDLGADSLDQVELVMALEEKFNVEISDEAAEKIVRVSDAVNFINAKN